ncbi:hypothetical protein MRX96_056278 [Rhipicephalus microplus]
MKPGTLLTIAAFGFFACVVVNVLFDCANAEKQVTVSCYVDRGPEDCSRYKSDGKTCDDLKCEKQGKICCTKDCNMTHFCLDDKY